MNNVKNLSIILLLSLGLVSFSQAKSDCNSGCDTSCSDSCDDDCNGDCNDDCDDDCNSAHGRTSTFFRPRPVTTDLTYRNNLTFYNRYHDARCNFFTWDSSFIYTKSRKGKRLGAGFLCANPLTVSEFAGADIAALNLQLSAFDDATPPSTNFESTFSICPERKTFSWLNQFYFNLDCFWTGLWASVDFAVVHARHELNINEDLTNGPSDLPTPIAGNTAEENAALAALPANVREAFDQLNTFANDCRHTGVDDLLFRVGYDYNYCSNDHIGIYFLGVAPTGKRFDNTRWFQPIVGSKHGAIGVGLTGDYTLWCDEQYNADLVFQTEVMYQFRLRHEEARTFDYNNGPCSRFRLVVERNEAVVGGTTVAAANNTIAVPGIDNLRACVRVEPRHQLEWWANLHYQWCNWGGEISYNLHFRDREHVTDCNNFDFNNFGIFSFCCPDEAFPLTTQSDRLVSDQPAAATANPTGTNPCVQDATFTVITDKDVNFCSGAAQRVLTHKIAGAISYNSVWCDCYPFAVGFGAGYEFVSKKDSRHALENWHIQGKFEVSF